METRRLRDDFAGDVHIVVTGPLGPIDFKAMRPG